MTDLYSPAFRERLQRRIQRQMLEAYREPLIDRTETVSAPGAVIHVERVHLTERAREALTVGIESLGERCMSQRCGAEDQGGWLCCDKPATHQTKPGEALKRPGGAERVDYACADHVADHRFYRPDNFEPIR